MGDIAQLFTALAALVTSLGGALAAVIVATRSGNRQAALASRKTMEMKDREEADSGSELGMDPDALEQMLTMLQRQRQQPSHSQQRYQPRREGGRR